MRKFLTVNAGALAASLALVAAPAQAHHPLAGMPMETFAQGVLSGIGHPILGFDHLFFILAVGIAALFTGRALMATGSYIAAMLLGCLLMSLGVALPAKEIVIGLSLLVVGSVILSGRALGLGWAVALFAGFGLFHGSAFGDSIAAQESAMGLPVLLGYLLGLGLTQFAIASSAGWVARRQWHATEATATQVRLAGAMVAGIGFFLTLENAEGMVFDMLAWTA